MVITAVNAAAQQEDVEIGMTVADARIMIPSLAVMNDKDGLEERLLKNFAEWFIRYSPVVAVDLPDGLILDITGCAHLWKGEEKYLDNITKRLNTIGYSIHLAIADSIGTAWAIARDGNNKTIISPGEQGKALLSLSPETLRIDPVIAERLHKLGLKTIGHLINISHTVLRRRFGPHLILRLEQALGKVDEMIQPVTPAIPYEERLPSLEPIISAKGIETALKHLLQSICTRLQKESKGLRSATLLCYRIDGKIEKIEIGTNRPSHNQNHLFKLFELKIENIETGLGIELFILKANKVESAVSEQEKLWTGNSGLDNNALAELLDRIAGKFGTKHIQRYLPAEHHWPERSYALAESINQTSTSSWNIDRPRPLQLLAIPELIEVTAPIPDYPPMLFRYKKRLHKIVKADGPERIEQEWWLQSSKHRDYYCVEDDHGNRYWLFRLGHYDDDSYQWFIHGFFP